MQIVQTQQLLKALAMDFIHNKSFNFSILELLCNQQKIHASTTIDQIRTKISMIDKAFHLLKEHCYQKQGKQKESKSLQSHFEAGVQKNFYNMVSIVVFNISAINEHYINEIQKQMAESTASQSNVDLNKTMYKDKMAISFLREQLQAYFVMLTEDSQFLEGVISDIQIKKRKPSQSQLGLLQTLDYLCVKYSVSNQLTEKVVEILEKNQNEMEESSSQMIGSNVVKEMNKLLFGQEKQQELFQLLESNSHVSFKNILSLISANYLNSHPQRKIFSTAQLSGKQTIQNIVVRMIKRIGKNELFNQKSQDYTPLRMLLFHFLNKHYAVYMEFNEIVKGLMDGKVNSNEGRLNLLKKIQRVFRLSITIENSHFNSQLQFISNQLSAKYNQTLSFELIKKLLLNRFFLNPSFYILYNEPDQNQIKHYVQAANIVRALFYPNKAEELSQRLNFPPLTKISSEILKSLEYCLKKQPHQKHSLQPPSTFLYINDKILKSQMNQLYDQIKQSAHNPREPLKQGLVLPNLISDYSLSFSLVKNQNPSRNNLSHPIIQNVSEVKFPNTNRSNANLKDNHSIRYMYDELKGQRSKQELPPKSPQKNIKPLNKDAKEKQKKEQNNQAFGRVSQLARKQHQLTNQTRLFSMKLPTDRQMIEQLVQMRKQYGEFKRNLKKQLEQRRSKHIKRMGHLNMYSKRFTQYKEDIERENNSLYVHMTTFA